MSELGYNVWGAVAGAIGTVALIPTLIYWFLCHLPTAKLRVVEQALKEAEAHFDEVLKGGLIHDEDELHQFHSWLWSIQFRVDDLRIHVYNIWSWTEELAHWWKGLSNDMVVICKETNIFRGKLAKSSSRERRALAAGGYTAHLASWSASQAGIPHVELLPFSFTILCLFY
ncbi:hypothetical protein BD414DRAFT_540586 [Trametes punicea]|nr:hypothetical protein BD414DRAFT_540586 [Trametes punicea]